MVGGWRLGMGIYVNLYWGDWNYNRYLKMDFLYIFERDCWGKGLGILDGVYGVSRKMDCF